MVTRAPAPELVADRADDPVDRLVVMAVKRAERRLQVPEQHLLQVIHARQVHRVEQVAGPITGGWRAVEQRPDLVCDLVKVVDRAQGGPRLGLLQRPFEGEPVAGPECGDAARVVVIEERAPRLVPLLDPQRCSPELDARAESVPQQGADGRLRTRVGHERCGHRLEIARRPRQAHRLGAHRAIQLPQADVDGLVEAVWTRAPGGAGWRTRAPCGTRARAPRAADGGRTAPRARSRERPSPVADRCTRGRTRSPPARSCAAPCQPGRHREADG